MITQKILSTYFWVSYKYDYCLYILPKIRMIYELLIKTSFVQLDLLCRVDEPRSANHNPTTLHTNKIP